MRCIQRIYTGDKYHQCKQEAIGEYQLSRKDPELDPWFPLCLDHAEQFLEPYQTTVDGWRKYRVRLITPEGVDKK